MKSLTRRQFLKGAGAVSLATILGACKVFPDAQETPEEPIPDPKDYLPLTIEYDDSVDLSDTSMALSSNERVVRIRTPVENSIYLGNGRRTNEVLAVMLDSYNEVDNQLVGIFYKDPENVPSDIRFLTAEIAFNYDVVFKDRLDRFSINKVTDVPKGEEYLIVRTYDEKEALNANFHIANGEINSLGRYSSLEESGELTWKPYRDPEVELGTKLTDWVMKNGVIVKSPRIYGASDKVRLNIPLQ